MCEQFVARADEPFRIAELWPLAERLERYGIAGFEWGAAWATGRAEVPLDRHRAGRAFADDPGGREAVGAIETTAVLVHLRRPSRLSTLGRSDTQPFMDARGRFAFSHNGEFSDWRSARRRYRDEGRIRGRADSEVGARWLEDAWVGENDAPGLLRRLHKTMGGVANLAMLAPSGAAWAYAGNPENPVFTFRLGRISLASTGIYSLDRSLFRFAAPAAVDKQLVRQGSTVPI
jgi:hypothetical protein